VSPGLLERIADGDQTAVKECMDAYGSLIWSLARRFCPSAADAEDATQDIFLEVWRSAARYDSAMGSEAVFITTIARRRLIDRMRARKRRPVTEEFDEDAPSLPRENLDLGAQAVEVSIAARALSQLGDAEREMLLMGIVEGMSHSEIAAATGKPIGTVKTQLRRGLIKIRTLLGTLDEENDDG
jgi:RNA polymerase sigma-70 factor, ECF subfamily